MSKPQSDGIGKGSREKMDETSLGGEDKIELDIGKIKVFAV